MDDALTDNLVHVLYEECENKHCPLHHPVGAVGMNRRDLTLYVAGAQALMHLFLDGTDEQLGLKRGAPYPSARIARAEFVLREHVERWLLADPKVKKRVKVRSKRGRRVLRTFR